MAKQTVWIERQSRIEYVIGSPDNPGCEADLYENELEFIEAAHVIYRQAQRLLRKYCVEPPTEQSTPQVG